MRIWRIASLLLAFVLTIYVVWYASSALDLQSLRQALNLPVAIALLAASASYALIYPLSGWAWARLLDRQQSPLPILSACRIIALTQLAKYIPGNVAQHLTRAGLTLRQGVPARAMLATFGQETLLTMTASILVGSVTYLLSGQPAPWEQLPGGQFLLPAAIATSLVVCLLASLDIPVDHLLRHSHRWCRLLAWTGGAPGWRTLLPTLLTYACNYMAAGLGIWLLATALGTNLTPVAAIAAFSLSWILGFLSPGAPAGLGTREACLLLLLAGSMPPSQASLLVLLSRLSTVLADLCVFLLAIMARPIQVESATP